MASEPHLDVVVVGAGFAGLDMLRVLKEDNWKCCAVEKGDDVGGTWYHNRYPGARCDVESTMYSYEFDQELQNEYLWKTRYPQQKDIQAYLQSVAKRYNLYPDIHFNTCVKRAVWDHTTQLWSLELDGQIPVLRTRFLISAVGCLSAPIHPKIPGKFKGPTYHTAMWPKDAAYQGKRLAIIGTGSSAVQAIPELAKTAKHLYVLQRTPNYVFPARQQELSPDFVKKIKEDYANIRAVNKFSPSATAMHRAPASSIASALAVDEAYRNHVYEEMWKFGGFPILFSFNDLFFSARASASLQEWVGRKIADTVQDQSVAKQLVPSTALGCKRPCYGTNYYETFNKGNVTLVNVQNKAIEYCDEGLKVANELLEVDLIVTATGFDAMTGSLTRMNIIGSEGKSLTKTWADGPHTLLGIQVAGFPNFFTITGPASPSVLTNMVPSIEQHVEWISELLMYLRANNVTLCEAESLAQGDWSAHCDKLMKQSVYPSCNSWYVGSNVPGKARATYIYTGGLPAYAQHCQEVALRGYPGFRLVTREGDTLRSREPLSAFWVVTKSRIALVREFIRVLPMLGKYGPENIKAPKFSVQVAYLISANKRSILQVLVKLAGLITAVMWLKRSLSRRKLV